MVKMYFTMLPLIFGGIFNMLFTKTSFYKKYKHPIDGGKKLKDNKRIFGDNKTWIGFISMILFCMVFQIIFGCFCDIFLLTHLSDWYNLHSNNILYNCIIGIGIGFTYMICELPNSFIKRRLNIQAGKHATGIKGIIFFIIDQVDSLLGVMFLLYLFSGIFFMKYIDYVLLGAITHIIINFLLYSMKVRKTL